VLKLYRLFCINPSLPGHNPALDRLINRVFYPARRSICRIPVFVFLIVLSPASCRYLYPPISSQIKNENGIFDLENQDFENGPVCLCGQWLFYPEQFLEPGTDSERVVQIPVPAAWEEISSTDQVWHSGTYITKVRVKNLDNLMLRIRQVNSAVRLWVDSREVGSLGRIGKTEEQEIIQERPLVVRISPEKNIFEIRFQISNFSDRRGGLITPVLLGKSEQISAIGQAFGFGDVFFAGALMMAFIMALGMYFARPGDESLLWISLVCLLTAIHSVLSGERTIQFFFPDRFDILLRIELISTYLAVGAYIAFSRSIFPLETNRIPVRVLIAIAVFLSFVTTFLSLLQCTQLLSVFLLLVVCAGVYLTRVFFQAVKFRRPGSRFLLFGFLLMFLTTVYEIVVNLTTVPYASSSSAGVAFFLSLSVSAVSRRLARGYARSEFLTKRILKLNSAYRESRKNERRARIHLLKERIEPHFLFNSLNSIRHLMRSRSEKAEEALFQLAEGYRLILASANKPLTTLSNELNLLQSYLAMQMLRFSDTLTVSMKVASNLSSLQVPPMLLQPIVENCFVHGRLGSRSESIIQIIIRKWKDGAIIIVRDNGHGIDEKLRRGRTLDNIKARLASFYREKNLVIQNRKNHRGTIVILSFYGFAKDADNSIETRANWNGKR